MKKNNVLKFMGVLLVWLLIVKPSVGSNFIALQGPGCTLPGNVSMFCGYCFSIPTSYRAGYVFRYDAGQPAYLYNSDKCEGTPDTELSATTQDCNGFGWNSIFIQCS
ncbi:hypothetical protein SUGI_0540890 [Cryptomeria japonica]|uniref:antimicrobial peptide 1-like n=1 Tax=Cryptomeria japonica TaxID=3369 RepID=UPI002408DC8D|nr:antimicrobial peptide 1-like [Cryptomeria japonica]GLJ27573.1 hypothetical protein SUGI_0540890 [Cryptomeria japonica]